jgi:tetratricopeptide (TPR) repeat protein
MYLKGSKWNMNRRTKRANPWRVIILIALVAAAIYVNQVIVPVTPPLFIPTSTPTTPPESFITKAQELEAQGKFSQAIAAYQDAIKADPKNPALYLSLAKLQIFAARYDEAISNTGNVMLLSPNNPQAMVLQAWAKGMSGDFTGADSGIDAAIKVDPTNAMAYAVKTIILSLRDLAGEAKAETRDQAIETSRTAVSMAPEMLETHWARGLVLEITANYTDALAEYQSAIQINDKIPELHISLGRTYRALQESDKAIEEFNRANALNPSDPVPLTLIARTYANQGEYGPAIQYATDALKNAPNDPDMYGNLGWLLYHNFQYEDAIVNLQLAIQGGTNIDGIAVKGLPLDYGRVAEYYYTYGLALAKLGYCNEALPIAQAILNGVHNDEIAVFNGQEIINVCQTFADSGKSTPLPITTPTRTLEPTLETPTTSTSTP